MGGESARRRRRGWERGRCGLEVFFPWTELGLKVVLMFPELIFDGLRQKPAGCNWQALIG